MSRFRGNRPATGATDLILSETAAINQFSMPVPGEYNLKGIFITLWLTVG